MQFLRHKRVEYDGCQKGVNSIAFPTSCDLVIYHRFIHEFMVNTVFLTSPTIA